VIRIFRASNELGSWCSEGLMLSGGVDVVLVMVYR